MFCNSYDYMETRLWSHLMQPLQLEKVARQIPETTCYMLQLTCNLASNIVATQIAGEIQLGIVLRSTSFPRGLNCVTIKDHIISKANPLERHGNFKTVSVAKVLGVGMLTSSCFLFQKLLEESSVLHVSKRSGIPREDSSHNCIQCWVHVSAQFSVSLQ